MQYKRVDAMTLRSDEIIWWNTLEGSLLSLIATAIAFSSAITDIAVNPQKNVIQHYLPYNAHKGMGQQHWSSISNHASRIISQ